MGRGEEFCTDDTPSRDSIRWFEATALTPGAITAAQKQIQHRVLRLFMLFLSNKRLARQPGCRRNGAMATWRWFLVTCEGTNRGKRSEWPRAFIPLLRTTYLRGRTVKLAGRGEVKAKQKIRMGKKGLVDSKGW